MNQLAYWLSQLGPISRCSLVVLWLLSAVCLIIMKKIQPDTFRVYLVYVCVIVIGLTVFALWLSVQGKV